MWIEARTGGGGGGGTSLTPSNSSPATITNGENYTADGSGYAIESYSNLTPSATPADVSSGSIYKMGGAGKVVSSIVDLTPSGTAQGVTAGVTYKMGGSGKVVDSISDVTPSSSSPASLQSGHFYKPTAAGFAISNYYSKTPDDSAPPSLSPGNMYAVSGTGYLYATQQAGGVNPTIKYAGNITKTSSATETISLTSSYLVVFSVNYSGAYTPNSQVIYSLINGSLSVMQRASNLTAITASLSGTTLTMSTTGNSAVSATLIQLY